MPEGAGACEKFPEQRLLCDLRPRAVARHAHEELIALAAKSIAPCDPQELERRVGIPVGDRAAIVEVPEPDVLRAGVGLEEAVLGLGNRATADHELRAIVSGGHGGSSESSCSVAQCSHCPFQG